MRKPILCFLVLVLIMSLTCIASAASFEFRKVNLGMTKQQVMDSEESSPIKEFKTALHYKAEFLEKDWTVVYGFDEGKLVEAYYSSLKVYDTLQEYINIFSTFAKVLGEKWGKPFKSYAFGMKSPDDAYRQIVNIKKPLPTQLLLEWDAKYYSDFLMIYDKNVQLGIRKK